MLVHRSYLVLPMPGGGGVGFQVPHSYKTLSKYAILTLTSFKSHNPAIYIKTGPCICAPHTAETVCFEKLIIVYLISHRFHADCLDRACEQFKHLISRARTVPLLGRGVNVQYK